MIIKPFGAVSVFQQCGCDIISSVTSAFFAAGNMEVLSEPETYFDYMVKRGELDPVD